MQFSDKMNFLMNITQTSNKDLAREISVDRSLISLLRNGKRGIPRNQEHVRHMAAFFAQHCTADFQRYALAEMIGLSALRSSMPSQILASYLESWLLDDMDMVEHLLEGINTVPAESVLPASPVPLSDTETSFYYGEEGRREAMNYVTSLLQSFTEPCTIYAIADDSLDWLLSDFYLSSQLQSSLCSLMKKGFDFQQIMPAMNFPSRYTEALRFWLPMYSTGQMQVYYYPRIRDNLYRHSITIVPGHFVEASLTIGLNSQNHITLFSTSPALINAYMEQFQEHLKLCRPALITHTNPAEFFFCFQNLFACKGEAIQNVSPLSINTLPRELLERFAEEADAPTWKRIFQMYLESHPRLDEHLKQHSLIDMSVLAKANDVRAGKVYVGSLFPSSSNHPRYTPETYIRHLENILWLMEHYKNYCFVPLSASWHHGYNLFVCENQLALLVRTSQDPLMLEILRPEMIQACQEYLLRVGERAGYDGMQRGKIRAQILGLIRELQE